MKIIEKNYKWNGGLGDRRSTKYVIIHHRAGFGDADSIHKTHINNGWTGIGYHFYVRTNGEVYRGRPIEKIGAHCTGKNWESIGVCFEGNFETETAMPDKQIAAGRELISYIKGLYQGIEIKKHRDFEATACPGKNLPFEEIIKGAEKEKAELTSANDITWELSQMIKINDVDGFRAALEKAKQENSPLYWGFRKLVNK